MKDIESIELALQTEQRTSQRQRLLKRLWRLKQRDQSIQPVASESDETKDASTESNSKNEDTPACVLARA